MWDNMLEQDAFVFEMQSSASSCSSNLAYQSMTFVNHTKVIVHGLNVTSACDRGYVVAHSVYVHNDDPASNETRVLISLNSRVARVVRIHEDNTRTVSSLSNQILTISGEGFGCDDCYSGSIRTNGMQCASFDVV